VILPRRSSIFTCLPGQRRAFFVVVFHSSREYEGTREEVIQAALKVTETQGKRFGLQLAKRRKLGAVSFTDYIKYKMA
jgi:hypothetical protein